MTKYMAKDSVKNTHKKVHASSKYRHNDQPCYLHYTANKSSVLHKNGFMNDNDKLGHFL